MKLRHVLYDLTDVLLLHLVLNVPGVVVELLSLDGPRALVCYILGVAWAIAQLLAGVLRRDRLLRWWERIPAPLMWSVSSITVMLFLAGLLEEVAVHGWS